MVTILEMEVRAALCPPPLRREVTKGEISSHCHCLPEGLAGSGTLEHGSTGKHQ